MPTFIRLGVLLFTFLLYPSNSPAQETCSGLLASYCVGEATVSCTCDGSALCSSGAGGCNWGEPCTPVEGTGWIEEGSGFTLSSCCYLGFHPSSPCDPNNLGESTCSDACAEPPPDCSGTKCQCNPNNEKQPVIGDPVNAVTGDSILVETDLSLSSSLETLTFIRHYTSSTRTWLTENLVHAVPKPFGSIPSQKSSMYWWHEHYSFVYLATNKWVVVKGTGTTTRFAPCTGTPCTATALSGSLNKRERLQRTSTGFILTEAEGRKLHFEAKHVGSGSRERYFLSRVVSPRGVQEAVLTYAAPAGLTCPMGNTGSAPGVPYLASINTASSGLEFQYVSLLPAQGAAECVLRSVKRRGETTAAVTYTYAQDSGSVERPGVIATASLASKDLNYLYSGGAMISAIGNMLVTRHEYNTTGAVTTANTTGEQLTIGASTLSTCESGSDCCGMQPLVRSTTDTASGRGDGLTGSSGLSRAYKTLANTSQTVTPRLYQTTDTCSTSGACSPGSERYEWACATSGLPAYEKARKNKRDFWEVYTHAAPASSTGMPPSLLEMTSIKRGAVDMTGTGALEEETFAYSYGPTGEQLLSASEKPSVLGTAGQKARTFNRYDSSGRLEATIKSGWTRIFNATSGVWSSQQRWIATFYRSVRTGESTPDALGRTLETRGPCLVASEAATDCVGGTTFPVTRSYYWPDTETTPRRSQLQKVAVYPSGTSGPALETIYNAYDASGHVTEMVDANGVTTLYTYRDDQLLTQTVRVSGQPDVVTSHAYDSAGNRIHTLHPEGNYEVFCFREGTTSGCTGGPNPNTDKLRWKAKSSNSTATTWSEKVTYSYWPDGTVKEERYLDAAGNTRKVFSYAADAHRRTTWLKAGSGTGSYVSTKSFDAANNPTGNGKAFNSPPAWCAAGPDGQPTSAACISQQYDGANRLVRMDEHPTSTSTNRTCFKHDAHGNIASVDVGLAATVDCSTATPTSKASRYLHDDFGRLVEVTLAATGNGSPGTTRFTYDAMGSLLVKQTPAMASAHAADYLGYTYDALGRLLSASHFSPLVSGGAEGLYAMAYDSAVTPPASCGPLTNTLGRLLYRDDSFGRTWYSYDAWGRTLKEVRLRTGTSTCSASTPYQNPHTLYAYSLNGNLTQVTYPYGRTITYTYGSGAFANRVSGVNILTYSPGGGSTSTPVVSQVAWEPYGGLRGYRTHYAGSTGSVEYALGDDSSAPPSACPTSLPSTPGDSSGRIRALWVSSLASGASFAPGTGNGAVLKQFYTWKADQLVRSDSCLLGASIPRTETYSYDAQLRMTGASGALSTQGGAFSTRTFGFDTRSNRTSESGEANAWAIAYDSNHPDRLNSRNSTQSNSSLGYNYEYDADGRVSRKNWRREYSTLGVYQDLPFWIAFGSGPSSSGATDSVFKSLNIRDLTYDYFYDAGGKRRLKVYPTGIQDEYFYDLEKGLLVDQGNSSILGTPTHPVDEYVWLDGRPIALIRSKLDASWFHEGTADCTRLGDPSACGVYHLVTDYLGKPVVMLDSQGRVTGTGEYSPSGHVNRVSVDIETPHPYTPTTSAFGAVMKQPAITGTSLQQRVLFDNVGLFSQAQDCPSGGMEGFRSKTLLTIPSDSIDIRDASTNLPLATVEAADGGGVVTYGHTWTPWFVPGADGVNAHLNNSGIAYCSAGFDCSGIQCIPVCGCNTTAPRKKHLGATISAYEYRRFQTGGAPVWTPLRYPGQYYDIESDLFENWNRFYDPNIGRYLQPEPILQSPKSILAYAREGHNLPAYAYALNNPTGFVDRNGENPGLVIVGVGVAAGEAAVATGVIGAGVYCIGTQCLGDMGTFFKSRWEKAKKAIDDICAKPRKDRDYACITGCQGNGATGGADYLVGWSSKNCAEATERAKASAGPEGQKYPRHCSCRDTNGNTWTGTQCE